MAFLIENETSEQCHWILHIRIPVGTRLHLKLIILTFLTKLAQKGAFLIENKKSEYRHCILCIQIGLGSKFYDYFWSKTETVKITIIPWMFELV